MCYDREWNCIGTKGLPDGRTASSSTSSSPWTSGTAASAPSITSPLRLTDEEVGPVAVEITLRFAKIIDDSYSAFMQGIWGGR